MRTAATAEQRDALGAYWSAQTREQERAAVLRMRELGMSVGDDEERPTKKGRSMRMLPHVHTYEMTFDVSTAAEPLGRETYTCDCGDQCHTMKEAVDRIVRSRERHGYALTAYLFGGFALIYLAYLYLWS